MGDIAALIDRVLGDLGNAATESVAQTQVQELTGRFPLYAEHLR